MDQLIAVEQWPEGDRPGTIAYFCGALDAPWPPNEPRRGSLPPAAASAGPARMHGSSSSETSRTCCPGVAVTGGFRWELLCGAGGAIDDAALDTQLVLANVDPSDRYVRCAPGTDRYRLRSDESGYDNLFLAGDWTDSGLNAGCIEAADHVGPPGGQRRARSAASAPHRRLLPRLSRCPAPVR